MLKKVVFKFGSRADYDSLPQEKIFDNVLYFLLDTNELYRGTVPICKAHYYEGQLLRTDPNELYAITRILNGAIPCENDIVVINKSNGTKHPYLYVRFQKTASGFKYGWKPLYGNIEGENIVFNDGESLLDKLNTNNSS